MRRLISITLTVGLLVSSLAFTRCSDPDKAQRTIAAASYDAHLAVEAANRVAEAFNQTLNEQGVKRLSDPSYKAALRKLKEADEIVQRLALQIEAFTTIDATNKAAVITLIKDALFQVQGIMDDQLLVKIQPQTQGEINRWLMVVQIGLSGLQVAIAAIQTPTPTANVLVAQETVEKVGARSESRISDSDVRLISRLSTIATSFAAQIAAQKGQTIEALRTLRDDQYQRNLSFFASQGV